MFCGRVWCTELICYMNIKLTEGNYVVKYRNHAVHDNRGIRLYRYAGIHDLAHSYIILIMIDAHKITHINYGFIITMSNLA